MKGRATGGNHSGKRLLCWVESRFVQKLDSPEDAVKRGSYRSING